MTSFVFLRSDDEDNNSAVARCAEEVLAPGPMADTVRGSDYESFLADAYGNGRVARKISTSCAVFAGACCILAGAQPKRGIPVRRAITTWAGVRGFVEDNPTTEAVEGSWIPASKLPNGVRRGDLPYICSTRGRMPIGGGKFYEWTTWEGAANGHVIVALDDGWIVRTAEGGGSPGGTGCRLSAGPKDLRTLSRTFRGVWRPNLMGDRATADTSPTEPAPPPSSQPPPAWVPPSAIGMKLHAYGDTVRAWQARLVAAGHKLPRSTRKDGSFDGDFGPETEAATRAVQRDNLLPQTGVVDRTTWEKAVRK